MVGDSCLGDVVHDMRNTHVPVVCYKVSWCVTIPLWCVGA